MRLNATRFPCALLILLLPAGQSFMTRGAPPTPGAGFRPVLLVEATYPGANAQVIADTVAAPIEQQVNGVEHLKRMVSRCTDDGRYTLQLSFDSSTDLHLTQVMVQNRISLAVPNLPAEVHNRGISVRRLLTGPSLVIVLTSPDASRDTMYVGNYASMQIKDELARLADVGNVSLLGAAEVEVRIALNREKLAARNLTPDDVVNALRQQNLRATAGAVKPPTAKGMVSLDLRLDTLGRAADLEALEGMVLKSSAGGALIRLNDVAVVEVGRGAARSDATFDGRPGVALVLSLTPDAKPGDVSALVRGRMERLKEAFPPGLDYSMALDFAPPGRRGGVASEWCLLAEPVVPAATSAERAANFRNQYATILRETVGVRHVLALSESPFDRFRGGPCVVAVFGEGMKEADWGRTRQDIRAHLGREVQAAEPRLRELAGPTGVWPDGYPVDLAMRGPDVQAVREFGKVLAARLNQSGKITDVAAGPKISPRVEVEIDRTSAAALGVSMANVSETLRVAFGSADIDGGDHSGRSARVRVYLDTRPREAAIEVMRVQVRGAGGQMVPLSRVAALRDTIAPTSVDRVDLRPAATISGNPAAGVSLAEARWLCETLAEQVRKELRLPADYELVWLHELPAPKPIPGELKPGPEPPLPEVTVARPVTREVADYQDFVGRIDAVESVELRARVSGYLVKTLAPEGSEVKKGDLLFEIDPRPYQAHLNQAKAELDLAKSRLKLAEATRARLQAANASKPELDEARAAVDEANSRIAVSQAAVAQHQLELDFCRVTAPIDGLVGRNHITVGNLVTQDTTLLTTIVGQGRMYAYFDMDERTYLRVRRAIQEARIKAMKASALPVAVGLAHEDGFPHEGTIDFVDNRVDPETGTLKVRAVVLDTKRLLRPGLFARVRLAVGEPHKALLLPEEAIGSDLDQRIVYVLDAGNKVTTRAVTVGVKQGGLRVVTTGLRPDDRVIVESRTPVRPGQAVKPVNGPP